MQELFEADVASTGPNKNLILLALDVDFLGAELVDSFSFSDEELPPPFGVGAGVDEVGEFLVGFVSLGGGVDDSSLLHFEHDLLEVVGVGFLVGDHA